MDTGMLATTCAALMPNTLLVLSAIEALNPRDRRASPKTDDIAWALDVGISWVRRHGKPINTGWSASPEGFELANLSVNGHCAIREDGRALVTLMRGDKQSLPAPQKCCGCGASTVGEVVTSRQLYACGAVSQFCPSHVPGHAGAIVHPRARNSQHGGTWFQARFCGDGNPEYRAKWRNSSFARAAADVQISRSVDGTELVSGIQVTACYTSPARYAYGEVVGVVVAAANGTVMVSWPEVAGKPGALHVDVQTGFAALPCDLVRACNLVCPGELDLTKPAGKKVKA